METPFIIKYFFIALSVCFTNSLLSQLENETAPLESIRTMTSKSYDVIDSNRVQISEELKEYNEVGQIIRYVLTDSFGTKIINEFIYNKEGNCTDILGYLNSNNDKIYEDKLKYNKDGKINVRTSKSWPYSNGIVENSKPRIYKIEYTYNDSSALLYEEHFSNDLTKRVKLCGFTNYQYNHNQDISKNSYESLDGSVVKSKEYRYDSIGLLQETITKVKGNDAYKEIELFEDSKSTQLKYIPRDKSKTRIENNHYNELNRIKTKIIELPSNTNLFSLGKLFRFDDDEQITIEYFYNDSNLLYESRQVVSGKILHEIHYDYESF